MSGEVQSSGTKLTFTYELTGERDAVATIGDGTLTVRMDVWLVTDALGDLLRCVVQLLKGYDMAWCVWEDDPGEHKWVFHRRGELVEIRILRFPTTYSGYGAPEEWATTIFETTCPLLKFARKVRDEARRLASGIGDDQYQRQKQAIPWELFSALQQLIQESRIAGSTRNTARQFQQPAG